MSGLNEEQMRQWNQMLQQMIASAPPKAAGAPPLAGPPAAAALPAAAPPAAPGVPAPPPAKAGAIMCLGHH